jgi:hypothetical protein
VLFHPAGLPLSAQTLTYAAGVIRRHREKIGPAWRTLNPGRQALLVLACLRNGDTFGELAAGFGDPVLTPCRGRSKPASQQEANRAHAPLRSPGERASAPLNTWRILRRLRCCPGTAGQLARAIHLRQARQTPRMTTLAARQKPELGWRCNIKGFRRSRAASAKDAAL